MEEAERAPGKTVPNILCNAKARQDMADRVQTFYDDLRASQTLTAFGKLLNYTGAYQCLTNHYGLLKLGMEATVAEERIVEPVFIVSLPRTGTTILHRTMAHDKDRFRYFDLCDMVVPLPDPVPRWDTEGRTRCLAKTAQGLLDELQGIYPGWMEWMETMHGFRVGEADEDLGWYDTGLGHMYFDILIKLVPENRSKPGGGSPLESKEVAEYRYAWLDMIMRIYQQVDKKEWSKRQKEEESSSSVSSNNVDLEAPTETSRLAPSSPSPSNFQGPCPTENLPWLMKDPNHSAYLPELLNQFPDAKFIFTHRTPADIVPSMAKLFVCFTSVEQQPGGPGTSAREWGQETVTRMHHYLDGMVQFTKDQPVDSPLALQTVGDGTTTTVNTSRRRMDFQFQTVVKDIPGTIETIYAQLYPNQPGPSPTAKAAFAAYLKENEREKRGNQRRSLEDFHLTAKDVAFSEYYDMFL